MERIHVHRLATTTKDAVRRESAKALGEIRSARAAPHLVAILTSADSSEGLLQEHYAADALGRIGPEAVGAVLAKYGQAASMGQSGVDMRALRDVLVEIGPPAVPNLIELAEKLAGQESDGQPGNVGHVLGTLGRIGTMSDRVVPYLCAVALGDPREHSRASAVRALQFVGPSAHARVTRTLMEALGQGSVAVRNSAVHVIGELKAEEAIPELIRLLSDEELQGREVIARCLGCFEEQAKNGIPALRKALLSESDALRREASVALWRIARIDAGTTPYMEEFIDILSEASSEHGRVPAALELGEYGSLAESAVPRIQELMRIGDSLARVDASVALWMITGEVDAPAQQLREEIEEYRRNGEWDYIAWTVLKLAEALKYQHGSEPVYSLIRECTLSSFVPVRRASVYALAQTEKYDEVATSLLIDIGMKDLDWRIRRDAVYAVSSRGLSESQLGDLRRVFEDESLPVRHAAKEVLGELASRAVPQDILEHKR